ncbi:hypothetical protein BLX24_02840 [Arsenicibacter rosenii]|uniref:Uncharacterized protein n=1 Tax=Arsenicibacter rosenii TaxID=1750698 RepID=A0A1S2VQI8_9BACT|nr:hypothetical protein BLX24_02840 [Arsenicibacter rosenii]
MAGIDLKIAQRHLAIKLDQMREDSGRRQTSAGQTFAGRWIVWAVSADSGNNTARMLPESKNNSKAVMPNMILWKSRESSLRVFRPGKSMLIYRKIMAGIVKNRCRRRRRSPLVPEAHR